MGHPPEAVPHAGLWELAVLCFLRERPMHPYEMQRLLRERHKDDVLVLKRGSLYHAIRRVLRSGLVEPVKTAREGRRPERTTYRITRSGEQELARWLQRIISQPRRETSAFKASLSFLLHLAVDDATTVLQARETRLEEEIAELDAMLHARLPVVTRINLIESEYLRDMRRAELRWVGAVLRDLQSGQLTWNFKAGLKAAATPPRAARRGRKRE